MDFSDTTTKQGLVQDALWWVNADLVSYPYTDMIRSANMGLNEVVGLILGADGRWQFDDTNYTDLPIGTTNMVASQQDYGIDTSMVDITRVECKDPNGNWLFLTPMDQKDLNPTAYSPLPVGGIGTTAVGNNYSLTDFMSVAGTPIYYDKIGNSIFLYPKPSYNSTAGLKVYFQRKASYFTTAGYSSTTSWTNTTKPGFANHLHRYISYYMAKDYAVAKMLTGNKITSLLNELATMKEKIVSFYAMRKKDEKVAMVARNTPSV
tara:strand:+ start:1623 stop:2411 length:789 start_codon:yes stop_codon:yes gene_type:complete